MVALHSKLHAEGEYKLNYVKLTNYKGEILDITDLVGKLTLEESLFAPIHVSLTLEDSIDLYNLFPIIGKEKVSFSFTRYDDKKPSYKAPIIMNDLPIYTMGNRTQSNNKMQIYDLYFTTNEAYKNFAKPVYKSFINKLYSEMVETIYNEYLKKDKPIEIENTKNFRNYVIQNQSPFEAIAMIKDKCISSDSEIGNSYAFFETIDKYNFKSFNSLFNQEPIYTLRNELKNSSDNIFNNDIERNIANIESPYTSNEFNNFKTIQNLESGCTVLSVNHLTRSFSKKEYTLKDDYDTIAHMGKYKSFDDTEKTDNDIFEYAKSSNIISLTSNKDIESNEYVKSHDDTVLETHIEDNIWANLATKRQLSNRVLKITVSGNPEFEVGKIIKVIIPEKAGDISNKRLEEQSRFSQNYLIAACAHIITPQKYICSMELLADAVSMPFKSIDIPKRLQPIVKA